MYQYIAYLSVTWWSIIAFIFIGFFILRFGMISYGASRQKIQTLGGLVLTAAFILMFALHGWRAGFASIILFWVPITPLVEVLIEKIKKSLYGEMRKHHERLAKEFNSTPELVEREIYESLDNPRQTEDIVERYAKKWDVKKSYSRQEMQDEFEKHQNKTP
ncbi:MAG: hypothetical protein HY422_01045 [Candidatus Komeilibacteria bacterium]|nr:hypothetical protein [Candidatus Komeilibacteria bacterium]